MQLHQDSMQLGEAGAGAEVGVVGAEAGVVAGAGPGCQSVDCNSVKNRRHGAATEYLKGSSADTSLKRRRPQE